MDERRRAHFHKLATKRYASERAHAGKGRSCDGEAEGLALAVLELLRETGPTAPIPERWFDLLGSGTQAKELAARGAYSAPVGLLGAELVEAVETCMALHAKLETEGAERLRGYLAAHVQTVTAAVGREDGETLGDQLKRLLADYDRLIAAMKAAGRK